MGEDAIRGNQAAWAAFAGHDWPTAYDGFSAVAGKGDLTPGELEALAASAWWLGRVDEAILVYERAFAAYLHIAAARPAASLALMIGFTHLVRGEDALGSAWLGRAARLLEDEDECPERGFLAYVRAEEAIAGQRHDEALTIARDVQEMGRRFAEPNLLALGIMAEGMVRIRSGDARAGSALLDEAMLVAVTEDLDPAWAGNIYCALMAVCAEIGDYQRASAWTHATTRWCEWLSAPGPFLGVCRMHRARVRSLHGAWEAAERDARQVCAELNRFERSSVAEAHYQLGELARLRGNLAEASASYESARELGRDPQPGYALLLLASGHPGDARASIETALMVEPAGAPARIHLRQAQVEICVHQGDLATALAAVAEMVEIAGRHRTEGHLAMALQAQGMVLLADDRAGEALPPLRESCRRWHSLEAVYQVARTRLLLARAHDRLGDHATSAREVANAEATLRELGASREILPVFSQDRSTALPSGVTEREVQVLELVARGLTNREIGEELFISPHTVSRHLENIYARLSIPSRAAAAAWATAHGLGRRRGANGPHGPS